MVTDTSLTDVIRMTQSLAKEISPLLQRNDRIAIEQMRLKFKEAFTSLPASEDIISAPIEAGGVAAEWIAAPNAVENCVILYLHGGGYVFGSIDTHRELAFRIAKSAGMRALCIDYRLAPESPFPAALEDAVATYRWLLSTGIKPEHIVIAGDSAGGGLAITTLLALRDAGELLPAAAVCLSPWIDLEAQGESMMTNAETDPIITMEFIQFLTQHYLRTRDLRNPLAAPLYADLTGLPPLLIQTGGAETLLDDAIRIAKRCQIAGVHTELEIWNDMIHVWQLFATVLPEGQKAIDRIGKFIRRYVRSQPLVINPLKMSSAS